MYMYIVTFRYRCFISKTDSPAIQIHVQEIFMLYINKYYR